MRKFKTILLFLLILSSCAQEKSLEISLPYNGDELVLYAFIGDSVQHAEVYKTQEVVETEIDFSINPLQLALYENQVLATLFDDNQNNFISNTILDTLSSFQIQLVTNESTVISKSVFFPEKIQIKTYQIQFNADSSKVLLNFSFDDKPEAHFYHFQIDKYYQEEIENRENKWFYENFRYAFSDENFNGQTFSYEEEIDLEFIKYTNGNIEGIENADAISITLYSLSEGIYQFYESIRQNSNTLGELGESNKPIWTNVNDGHGVVGTYRKDFLFIDF